MSLEQSWQEEKKTEVFRPSLFSARNSVGVQMNRSKILFLKLNLAEKIIREKGRRNGDVVGVLQVLAKCFSSDPEREIRANWLPLRANDYQITNQHIFYHSSLS